MNLNYVQVQVVLIAVCVLCLSGGSLAWAYKNNQLLTMVGGLHLNSLLIMGIGPLCYAFGEPIGFGGERVAYTVVLEALVNPYFCFLLGYVAWCLVQLKVLKRWQKPVPDRLDPAMAAPISIVFWGILGFIGYFLSLLPESNSGIGIIFPVLGLLFYPAMIMSILLYNRRQLASLIFNTLFLSSALIVTIFSSWRSQLIIALFSIMIGVLLRRVGRRGNWILLVGTIFMIYVLLPFQQAKKSNYADVSQDILTSFWKAQDISLSDRQRSVTDFASVRTNGGREIGYVQAGLEHRTIEPREGLTYWESVEQLVPRFLWPDKPSFNLTTNYLLPRQIGLLSWLDSDTSWSVNLWAEAIWNFPYPFLIVFVPLCFGGLHLVDKVAVRFTKHPLNTWMIEAGLFFLAFQIVTVVTVTTYMLWLPLVIWIIDRSQSFLKPRSRVGVPSRGGYEVSPLR